MAAHSFFFSRSSRAYTSSAGLLKWSGSSPDSIGIRTSGPKAKAYGVFPVGCLRVVR